LFLEDKHADRKLENGDSWELTWYDEPEKGQAVVASYCPDNYPCFTVFTENIDEVKRQQGILLTEEGWIERQECIHCFRRQVVEGMCEDCGEGQEEQSGG